MYTVLIADDEALERKALRKILSENLPEISYIEDSGDGQSALEKAREILPDLIILDIKMPRLNGLDAARKIKTFHPSCRIILLSGYTYFNYAKEAVSIGINDFLVKPVSDEELITSIKNLIPDIEKQKIQNHDKGSKIKKMNNICTCLENEFVTTLPFHQLREPYLSNHLETLDIDYTYSISVILTYEQQTEITKQDFEKIKEAVKSTFSKEQVLLQRIDNLIYCIVFLHQFMQKTQLKGEFNKLVDDVSTKLSKKLHIGVGTIKNKPSEIFNSFNEARRAFSSKRCINLFQRDVSTEKVRSTLEQEEQLRDCLLNGDTEKSLALFSEVYQILDTNFKDFYDFKIHVYEMLLVFNRRIRQELDLEDNLFSLKNLNDCSNKKEIKIYLVSEIQKILNTVNVFLSTSNKSWKKEIISYLEKNLHETVTLQDLADIACFSPSYLSRMFKKEFGMNCINYVNHLRIKEAKKLLLLSNLSIKEIAFSLGYSDSNYFARVFKKETGLNASQYKNSTTQNKNILN